MRDFTNQTNIESIEFLDDEIEMYDMEVDDVHCFYANGILVHNCSQEMALTANFSGEPHLLNPILEGKDIHNYIAKQMFGFEDPEHRTKVKICNFCVNYGGGPPTLAAKLGISVEEATKLLDHYNQVLSTLSRWKKEVIKEARRKGMVFTYFGRPRLLYPYYNSSDKSMWGFADRTAINSPIQGCLPAFTRVLTRHGYIPIVDITPGEEVWNGICWTPAELVPKGCARLVKVTTEDNNTLWCDDRHKLKVKTNDSYEWKSVLDLTDDLVCLNNGDSGTLSEGDFYDYLMGYTIGGGLLESHGMQMNRFSTTKNIPKSIWFHGAKTFLRGLYDSAGLKKSDAFCMMDKELLEQVSVLVNQAGFSTHLSANVDGTFTLSIKGNCFLKWLNEEGSTSPYFVESNEFTCSEHYHCSMVKSVEVYDDIQEMYTLATLHPLHQFVTEGFISKNTGGDLIRIDHVKLLDLFKNDKEFAENCLYACTIHDEINLFVKPCYIQKAFNKLTEIMYFKPKNFKVPISATPSVGIDWGHLIDCDSITDDNKIVLDSSKVLPLDW